jgi:hypothetical protein
MLIKVIRNDTGQQKQARIESIESAKRKMPSKKSGRKSKSISQTPKKVARIPIMARAANEMIPVLVTS